MRALLVACILLVTAGTAGAAVPPVSSEEIVGAFGWLEYEAGQNCSSYDPLFYIASTTITSRLAHSESGGVTTYTIHLDGAPADPSCPAIDFEFLSSMSWPELGGSFAYGTIKSACGATGSVYAYPQSQGTVVILLLASTPAACGLPFQGSTQLYMQIQPLTSGRQVCTPLVLMGCSGVRQGEYYTGCPQLEDQFAIEVLNIGLVRAGHRCDFWTQTEYGYIGDGFGIVTIRTDNASCRVIVSEPFAGLVYESADCPARLGAAIDDQDWSRVLP